jgi:hypothetical protein
LVLLKKTTASPIWTPSGNDFEPPHPWISF